MPTNKDGEKETAEDKQCTPITEQASTLMPMYQRDANELSGYMSKLSMSCEGGHQLVLVPVHCQPIDVCNDNKLPMHANDRNDSNAGYSDVYNSRLCAINVRSNGNYNRRNAQRAVCIDNALLHKHSMYSSAVPLDGLP